MLRRHNAERCKRTPLVATLVGALWLSGCAVQETSSPSADNSAVEAYTQLGVAYLERDNLRRAMNALDRALQIAPEHSEALQAIALVYQRQGESALADEYFQQALRADPDFTRARNNYAAFLYDQERFKQACEQLEKASQDAQYANRTQLFTNLGQCYLALDETAAARTSLQRAQQIDPRNPRSYLMLAELEYSQGNYQGARQPLETYLRLAGPNQMALSMAIDIAHAEGEHAQAADYQRQLDALR